MGGGQPKPLRRLIRLLRLSTVWKIITTLMSHGIHIGDVIKEIVSYSEDTQISINSGTPAQLEGLMEKVAVGQADC
jgi:hypothetical protein